MADKKISELTELTAPDGTEELVVNDGGVSKKITQANLLSLADGVKATFGAGNGLQIYHDGNYSFIRDVGTGSLYIDANDLYMRDVSGNRYLTGVAAAEVRLYHNNSEKLATTSTGIDVTGKVAADSFSGGATSRSITISESNGNDSVVIHGSSGDKLELRANSNTYNQVILAENGNVGIKTSSPIVEFDVTGRIKANAIYPSITAGAGTSGSSGEYWKLGSLALYGSQSAKIRVGGTQSYSSGSNISGETTIHLRGNNNTTIVSGHFYGNTQGNPMVSDVCYKQTSNDVFDIYIRTLSTFSGLDTWVDCAGNWTPALSNTGSTSAPSGSVALPSLYTVATSGVERMRITSGGDFKMNGDVGIQMNALGTVSLAIADSGAWMIVCRDSTGTTDKFRVASNGNAFNTNNSYGAISDIKLKENIVDATPKLDDLMSVKIRKYNLIGEVESQIGVIAQELEDVFPSLVEEFADHKFIPDDEWTPQEAIEAVEATFDDDGVELTSAIEAVVGETEADRPTKEVEADTTTKTVKYSVFVPMLIKAMQEQQEMITGLTARIEVLEA